MKSPVLFLGLASAVMAGGKAIPDSPVPADDAPSWPGIFAAGKQRADLLAEILSTDDIEILTASLNYNNRFGPWTLNLGLGQNSYRVDYSSVFTSPTPLLEEETILGNVSLDRAWNSQWSTDLHASAYDGFAEYRSIWIAEFYRNANSEAPGYREPSPRGHGFGTTTRWDYLPQSGSASLSLDYARDTVAPGYAFNEALLAILPGEDKLDTISGRLKIDQAINGWLTTSLTLSARETTARDPRYGVENAWAAAYGKFAMRVTGGFTHENPEFEALYGGVIFEWNPYPFWFAHLGARIYSDTGEIETSGFSTAAPGVESSELYAGILWDNGTIAINLGVGFLSADYDALDESNQFLSELYLDRDWYFIRTAVSYSF